MPATERASLIIERLRTGAKLSDHGAPLGQRWVLEEPGRPADVVTAQEMRWLVVEGFVKTDTTHPNCLAELTTRGLGSETNARASVAISPSSADSNAAIEQPSENIADEPAAPPAQPYTFNQLVDRETESGHVNLIFHVHVPKAGGNTVATLLRQSQSVFVPLEFDMTTSSFFQLVPEERWLNNYKDPDTATAFLMTGHFRLDAQTLRNAPMPHAIVTTLRDPVARVLSHYNHTLRVPGSPWQSQIVSGEMSFAEYAETLLAPYGIGPQYSFFDDTGAGTFARSGNASAKHCLDNLLNKVGIFGFLERFDEFAALAAYLLNSKGALVAATQNVTGDLENTSGIGLKTSLTGKERSKVEELFAEDVWFYEQAKLEYERRISDPRLQAVIASTVPLLKKCRENIEEINRLGDQLRRSNAASASDGSTSLPN